MGSMHGSMGPPCGLGLRAALKAGRLEAAAVAVEVPALPEGPRGAAASVAVSAALRASKALTKQRKSRRYPIRPRGFVRSLEIFHPCCSRIHRTALGIAGATATKARTALLWPSPNSLTCGLNF